MARSLFLFIIAGMMGLISSTDFLSATDTVTLTGLNPTNMVETVPLPEPEPEPVVAKPTVVRTPQAGVAARPAPAAPANSITVAGRTIGVVSVGDTSVDAGGHVNKYGERFFYGHNSGAVFGGLSGLGVGSVFTITSNGVATNYQVAKVMIFEKNVEAGLLQLNGAGNYMRSVANAKSEGVQYSVSLMTCYGTSYGNGDASHRLVLFANAM